MAALDFPHDFITVYWLSGLFGEGFEIWQGSRDRGQDPGAAPRYTLYLLYPMKDEEPASLVLKNGADGLAFSIDWFPEEEFPLQVFRSPDGQETLLLGHPERETVFIKLS